MRDSERVVLRRIAGLSDEEIRRIEIAAERYEEHMRPGRGARVRARDYNARDC